MLSLLFAGLIFSFPVTMTPVSRFDRYGTERPPALYDHFPTRPLFRMEVPLQNMNQLCNPVTPSPIYYGCTKYNPTVIRMFLRNPFLGQPARAAIQRRLRSDKDLCVVLVPELAADVSFGWQWSIWTHELAHCNGAFHNTEGRGWYHLDGSPIW